MPQELYLRTSFTELITFSESIHILSSTPRSPYQTEARAFVQNAALCRLLSGPAGSQTRIIAKPHVYGLCRLTALLYIHSIFLDNFHSSIETKNELDKLRLWYSKQELDRNDSVESLVFLIFMPGNCGALNNPQRTLLVLKIMTVVKRLSQSTLDKLLSLFFGYLIGRKYSAAERSILWNFREIEEEVFGSEE